jgi:hypothetical protein
MVVVRVVRRSIIESTLVGDVSFFKGQKENWRCC